MTPPSRIYRTRQYRRDLIEAVAWGLLLAIMILVLWLGE